MKDPVPRSLSRSALLQYRRSNGDQETKSLQSECLNTSLSDRRKATKQDKQGQTREPRRIDAASPRSPQI